METPSQEESSAEIVKLSEETLKLVTQISEDQASIKFYTAVLVFLVGFIFLLYGSFLVYVFVFAERN